MKKLVYYSIMMLIVVVVMPMLIVRGCGRIPEETVEPDTPSKVQQQQGIKINVYDKTEDQVKTVLLEEYIKGVLAAEMPAEFGIEALKAQAVAARTYAVSRMMPDGKIKMKGLYRAADEVHNDADVCTDFAHCQAWISKQTAVKGWGIFNSYRYWRKIEKAVKETNNMVMVYNGKIINPLFHSNSGGRTENIEDVWEGKPEPYLKSVPSSGEEETKDYKSEVVVSVNDFINTMKKEFPDFKASPKKISDSIKVIDYTAGGRVKDIRIGNETLKGTKVRTLFSLKSANFKIEAEGKNSLKITVIGYGHGVGMSQWGANYLAQTGGSFEEILKYYYKGVDVQEIN
jgi:stage II sporulation protein D